MSSNITGVEKLKEDITRQLPEPIYDKLRAAIFKSIDFTFQLGRLDGGAFVAGEVEERLRPIGAPEPGGTIPSDPEIAADQAFDFAVKKLREAARSALSVLEKEAKGEEE